MGDVEIESLNNMIDGYVKSVKNGMNEFGKSVFPNGDTFNAENKIYAALITPVIHYTMGGLSVNEKAQIIGVDDNVMRGFYGAGEVTGGVQNTSRYFTSSIKS